MLVISTTDTQAFIDTFFGPPPEDTALAIAKEIRDLVSSTQQTGGE